MQPAEAPVMTNVQVNRKVGPWKYTGLSEVALKNSSHLDVLVLVQHTNF